MQSNMSATDRVIRISVAILVFILYFTGYISGVLAIILLIVAGAFIITSTIGFCPIYKFLGFGSRGPEKNK